ncbi:MAG TPA: DNA-binding response regulator, partial [Planctomycetota bacterium]|nr:DNA-binding response regulator [Planctomycetota bacterium]
GIAMITRALVVEDDDRAMPSVEDTLYSLGHEHRWAQSQEEAQKMLQASQFDYVLMDLEIPAKSGRGGASVQYGLNLAEHIHATKGPGKLPIIVMTGHGVKCLNMVEPLKAAGAREFITKPFPDTGRTLADVIKAVLNKSAPVAKPQGRPVGKPQPFQGGEMVFYPDRVELLGVSIISDKGSERSIKVLGSLRQQDAGRFVRRSSARLEEVVGQDANIRGCVRTMRENITRRLREELNIECGNCDVIDHSQQGYFLKDWIAVKDGTGGAAARPPPAEPVAGSRSADNHSIGRQEWALQRLRDGKTLCREDMEKEFDISERTAKRDLTELVNQDKIEFVKKPHPGQYRLLRG